VLADEPVEALPHGARVALARQFEEPLDQRQAAFFQGLLHLAGELVA
jgi:hypothetical protein